MSNEPTPADNQPTTEELADRFASQAVKSAMERARDGLQVFDHLAQKPRKHPVKPA